MMNITFDLETLSNTEVTGDAPIVQIGAVKFTDAGMITDEFLRTIEAKSIQPFNFGADYRTIYWWLQQDDKAIKSVFGEDVEKVPLRLALLEFIEWIGKPSQYVYWSHCTFDPPILNDNIRRVGLGSPIPFRLHRDIRTLSHFTGKIEVEREGVHHNALDDCRFQAKYISKGLQALNKFKETKMKYIEK